MKFVLALECERNQNLQARSFFFLRYAESQQTTHSQQVSPTGKWPLVVLCNECFQPSDHSEGSIRTVPVDSMAPSQLPPIRTWSIKAQFGQESCGVQTEMLFQAGIGSEKEHVLLKVNGHKISCPKCRRSIELNFQSCKNVDVLAEERT